MGFPQKDRVRPRSSMQSTTHWAGLGPASASSLLLSQIFDQRWSLLVLPPCSTRPTTVGSTLLFLLAPYPIFLNLSESHSFELSLAQSEHICALCFVLLCHLFLTKWDHLLWCSDWLLLVRGSQSRLSNVTIVTKDHCIVILCHSIIYGSCRDFPRVLL